MLILGQQYLKKKYSGDVASNGVKFIPNFVRISQPLSKLKRKTHNSVVTHKLDFFIFLRKKVV
jgi:hypothetical protein